MAQREVDQCPNCLNDSWYMKTDRHGQVIAVWCYSCKRAKDIKKVPTMRILNVVNNK